MLYWQNAAVYAMVCRYDGDIDMVAMGYRGFMRQRSSLITITSLLQACYDRYQVPRQDFKFQKSTFLQTSNRCVEVDSRDPRARRAL
jgi:hypothetical protein